MCDGQKTEEGWRVLMCMCLGIRREETEERGQERKERLRVDQSPERAGLLS
jgi:hypothetical protein